MFDPLRNKVDTEQLMLIAEVCAKFIARYIYTLKLNGATDEMLVGLATNLSHAMISHFLMNEEARNNVTGRTPRLEEFDVSGLEPN